ncbi:MAG: aminoacyl-tRNA hydrolase [Minisyncoccia bacterium]
MDKKFKMSIKLIIGLGNPEKNYEDTYHNIGYLFIDFLQKNISNLNGFKLILPPQKTNEYMNLSGQAIQKYLQQYKLKPKQLMIVHDDSDILFGNYKIQFARNSAGHKGVQSIINLLKTNGFWRIRIGIRHKNSSQKAKNLVLQKISPEDKKILDETFTKILNQLS